jgi:hypothetical protein
MNWKLLYNAYRLKFTLLLLVCFTAMQIFCYAALPQIQDVTISKIKNKITISWSVSAGQQTAYYEIEKAGQDKVFKTAGIIFPDQNEINKTAFIFKDEIKHTGSYGIVYYRVKQINANGTATYSLIKAIDLKSNKVMNIGEAVLIYSDVHKYSYPLEKYKSHNNTNNMMAGILRLTFNQLHNI